MRVLAGSNHFQCGTSETDPSEPRGRNLCVARDSFKQICLHAAHHRRMGSPQTREAALQGTSSSLMAREMEACCS